MPRNNLFQASLLLALSGIASAVCGIIIEQFKPILIGFVLLTGAGVFATLFLGIRRSETNHQGENLASPPASGDSHATR